MGIGQAEQVAMILKRRGCKNIVITRDLSRIPRVVAGKIPYILKDGPEEPVQESQEEP